MEHLQTRIKNLLASGKTYLINCSQEDASFKPFFKKWSKKEILGHLIDSGINNLQRFTEIQYETKPYVLRQYKQDALVIANDYQNADLAELLEMWFAINHRIINVIGHLDEATLKFEVVVDNVSYDLNFIVVDYVDHMEHHLKQIMN
ncbi:DinB family protein [Chondrinema litorale]|uniref:DinB family protein n=1 Tax=Chondrinema litorale TaxID=2994555 RepID=UPI002543B244|nr:DinB family protein [Chondrinema litorale]UZR95342.1 DinB family protein [Chondrinema litorale]